MLVVCSRFALFSLQIDAVGEFGSVVGAVFLDCAEELLIERMDKTNCDDPIAL